MRRYGKITLTLLLIMALVASVVLWTVPKEAQAASYGGHNMIIPFNGEAGMYVVFREQGTGALIDASTGATTTTWADAEITATNHTNSNDWVVAIPTTSIRFQYFTYWTSDPTDGTTAPSSDNATLYDTFMQATFTDTNRLQRY